MCSRRDAYLDARESRGGGFIPGPQVALVMLEASEVSIDDMTARTACYDSFVELLSNGELCCPTLREAKVLFLPE